MRHMELPTPPGLPSTCHRTIRRQTVIRRTVKWQTMDLESQRVQTVIRLVRTTWLEIQIELVRSRHQRVTGLRHNRLTATALQQIQTL